jgi:hypothetical protein
MHQLSIPFALLAFFIFTSSLASDTKIVTTWKDPEVSAINFNKVVVAFMSSDADLRFRVEDGIARRIRRTVAAHTFVPNGELQDREAVKARLSSNAVDGAIVLRLIDVEKNLVVSPGQVMYVTYPSFWDMWGGAGWAVSLPDYATEDKVVTAEIILYSVTTAKPIWAGRLKATNPKSLRIFLDDLVKAGSKELKKQKLI